MSFELTQTIILQGIEEWSMTTQLQYPEYPEKGKDYSRHGYLPKESPASESATTGANAPEKSKEKSGAKHCDVCNTEDHIKDLPKKSREGKTVSPAACYTCGSEEHMKPDCPKNNAGKNVLTEETASTKSTVKSAKDDKAPSKGSLSNRKQLLPREGTLD